MCHPRFMLHCECSGLGCHMHGNIYRIYGNLAKVSWKYTMLQSQLILTAWLTDILGNCVLITIRSEGMITFLYILIWTLPSHIIFCHTATGQE